jgi:hypothetical protein
LQLKQIDHPPDTDLTAPLDLQSARLKPISKPSNGHDWTDRYPLIVESALRN